MGFTGVSYYKWRYFKLVGGFSPTHLKNMLVKLDHSPRVRDEKNTYLKPPQGGPPTSFNWVYGL